ncbi:MAG: divalent-cation tolerance protein CutA [Fibrobacterales bacterium]
MSIQSLIDKEYVVVYSTTNTHESALELSKILIESTVAACVQILPGVTSFYEWKGTVEQSTEYCLMIKTHKRSLSDIESLFQRVHPYDVPEFVVVSIDSMSSEYHKWFNDTMDRDGE